MQVLNQNLLGYKEEMEINFVNDISEDNIDGASKVTALGDNVKKYIPSLEDNDIGKFGIIAGKLYYIGEDDIGKRAAKSQNIEVIPDGMSLDEFVDEMELLAITSIVKDMGGDSFKDSDENFLGVELFDKNLKNSNKWKIITEVEDGKIKAIYGTDWYFVEKGKEVENIGVLKNDYILNYKTRKAVKFNAQKHSMMGYDSSVAVPENIIFGIDPSTIEKGQTDFGEGVSFLGYNDDLSDAYTSSEFIFDGVNDEIRIDFDDDIGKEDIKNNGLTFEFYGTWSEGTHYNNKGGIYSREDGACGLLEYKNKYTNNISLKMQMGFYPDKQNHFGYYFYGLNSLNHNYKEKETFGAGSDSWVAFPSVITEDVPFYATIVFLPDETFVRDDVEYFRTRFYLNSEPKEVGEIEKDAWVTFSDSIMFSNEIILGMMQVGNNDTKEYSKMNCYTMRIYSKALTGDEVIANYNASVSYHEFLLNDGNAETGGDTGGSDF